MKILDEVSVEGSRNLFHHVEKQFYNGYVPGSSKQMQTYSYTSGTRVNFWLESHVMVNAQYNLNFGGDNFGEVTENNLVSVWVMSTGDVNSTTEVSLDVNGEITTVQLQVDPDVPVIHSHEDYHGKAVFVLPNEVRSFRVKVDNPIWVENAKGRWVPTATALGLVPISPSTGWMPVNLD